MVAPVGEAPVDLLKPRIAYLMGRDTRAGSDTEDIERGIRDLYEFHRKENLEAHYWSFAQKQAILTNSTTDKPLFGYAYYAALPQDFLKVSYINFNGNISLSVLGHHEIHGNLIATDFKKVFLLYTRDIKEPEKFSGMFLKSLAYTLGQELALTLAGDKDVGDRLRSMASQILYDAQEWDYSNQGTMESVQNTDILESRLGGVTEGTGVVPGAEVVESPLPGVSDVAIPTPNLIPASVGPGQSTGMLVPNPDTSTEG